MIKKLLFTLSALAMSCHVLRGEQVNPTGIWEANFRGAIFLRINITVNEAITGTVSVGGICVDYDGNMLAAEPASPDSESPILNAKLEGATLRFEIDDEGELTQMEVQFSTDGKATIHFPDLAQKIKPIVLERR